MELENVKFGPSTIRTYSQISNFENHASILGEIENSGREHGFNKITLGREDCRGRNTATSKESGTSSVNGKVIDQLADEVKKQLEYHHAQTKQLEDKLKELQKLSGQLEEIKNSE